MRSASVNTRLKQISSESCLPPFLPLLLRSFVSEFAVELLFISPTATMNPVSSGTSVSMFACIVPFQIFAKFEYDAQYCEPSPRWK